MTAGDHVAGDSLTDIKHAGNVGGQKLLPLVGRKVFQRGTILHAGIVDENVYRADLRFDASDTCRNRGLVGRIECDGVNGKAIGGKLFLCVSQFRLIAAVENDCSAVFGKAASECQADALAGAGDQRGFTRQIEQRK
ncbi:hypothetical protein D3C87_1406980 [compost metagenome]